MRERKQFVIFFLKMFCSLKLISYFCQRKETTRQMKQMNNIFWWRRSKFETTAS